MIFQELENIEKESDVETRKQKLREVSTILEELLKQFNKLTDTIENTAKPKQTDFNRYVKNQKFKKGN